MILRLSHWRDCKQYNSPAIASGLLQHRKGSLICGDIPLIWQSLQLAGGKASLPVLTLLHFLQVNLNQEDCWKTCAAELTKERRDEIVDAGASTEMPHKRQALSSDDS